MQSKRRVDEFSSVLATKRHQTFGNGCEMPETQGKEEHRTLLLRNLTPAVTEADVRSVMQPFSEDLTLKILMFPHQGNAFVEFPTSGDAQAALNFMQQHPVLVKGIPINVILSKRPTLSNKNHSHKIHNENGLGRNNELNKATGPTKILLVSITNLVYPVDIELIHFLFSKFGTVNKIVCFSKNPATFQAFVQFEHHSQSKEALAALNNRNIYSDCNTIHVSYSNMEDLIVKSNSARSWDYTSAPLLDRPPDYLRGRGQRGKADIDKGIIPGFQDQRFSNGLQFHSQFFPQPLSQHLPRELRESMIDVNNPRQTPVIICYNLPGYIDSNKIFNLFSIYGCVSRIKILRDKPDAALIQYTSPIYASLANVFLQRQQVFGKELQISFSKNMEVKMPLPVQMQSEDVEGSKKTVQFNMRDQRYGTDEMQRYIKGACKPTKTAFIANLSLGVTEEELRDIISASGNVVKVRIKSHKESAKTQLALVEMETIDQTILCVMNLHNTLVRDRSIKIAFSKSTIDD